MTASLRFVACSILLGALLTSPHTAGAQVSYPVVARDSGAVVHLVAPGTYAIIHDDAIHDFPSGVVNWPHGNTGVIVGDDAVLVIDSDFFPSRAAADIALIRRLTDKPVRYLLNTHWHGDHTHGNAVYQKAFPDLAIVSATPNRDFIALNQARYPRSVIADGSTVRKQLATLDSLYAAGTDSTGRPFTAAQQRLLRQVIGELNTQLREFAAIEIAAPTMLFDDTLHIDLGGRTVELRNWGRANSPADVTAWLPRERVLFTGDIVVHPVPYVFGAYPGPWLPVLRAIERIPASAVVPGHGPVFANQTFTAQVRELLEVTADRMRALLAQGKTLAEVQRAVDLSDYRPRFVMPGDTNAAEYWEQSIKGGLVERTFQCLTGSRC